MGNMLKSVLRAISAACSKRQHDAQLDKVADQMVADLEAIVANMKREREVEHEQSETRRSAADGYTYPAKWRHADNKRANLRSSLGVS